MKPKLYDLSYLRQLSSGDEAFENSMIAYFIENTPGLLQEMDDLVSQQDWAEVRELIHRFIPNLNMMGADKLLDDANNVELYSEKRIKLDQISPLWNSVKGGCMQLIDQLKQDFQA